MKFAELNQASNFIKESQLITENFYGLLIGESTKSIRHVAEFIIYDLLVKG
jgi:hypothetical protein